MTLIEYPDVEQRSPEWHDLRRGIVTASTVAGLITPTLKVADNDTSRGITTALVAERITGVTESSYISDDMMRGILHEPIARGYYEEHHNPVREMGFMVEDRWGFQIGLSPDGLIGTDGCLEIKCPRQKEHLRTILADQVPAQYMAQCQTALLVSGRDWLDFVSFHAGMPLWTKRVRPDVRWHAAILEAAERFEESARRIVDTYRTATKHLPATEQIPDFDDIKVA